MSVVLRKLVSLLNPDKPVGVEIVKLGVTPVTVVDPDPVKTTELEAEAAAKIADCAAAVADISAAFFDAKASAV